MAIADKFQVVENMIETLGLKKCADTVIGTAGVIRGLSGGERKRLNIATCLLKSASSASALGH